MNARRQRERSADIPTKMRGVSLQRLRQTVMALSGVAILAVALGACGGSSGSSSGSGGASSVTTLNLGEVPFWENAPLALGEKVGIFAHYGIKVNLEPSANINVIIANMHSGHQQLGYLSVPLLLKADEAGQGLKCVSRLGNANIPDPSYPENALMVAKNSPITSVTQLAGKTVALNQLAGSNELVLQAAMSQAGGNFSAIKLATVPFADMSAAIKSGAITAGYEVQPFITTGEQAGDQKLLIDLDSLTAGWTADCYAATDSYIASHKAVLTRFVTAESQAILYAKAHPQDALAEIGPVSGISVAAGEKAAPPKIIYTDDMAAPTIIQYANFMKRYHDLSGPALTVNDVAWVAPGQPATKLLFATGGKYTG